MAWHANFVKHYSEISKQYDERFYRMWSFYLLSCAGAFRARNLQLLQIVMRKIEPSQPYEAVR
jgi:cyclopropane-fatty-acyl-phospholipid synthase